MHSRSVRAPWAPPCATHAHSVLAAQIRSDGCPPVRRAAPRAAGASCMAFGCRATLAPCWTSSRTVGPWGTRTGRAPAPSPGRRDTSTVTTGRSPTPVRTLPAHDRPHLTPVLRTRVPCPRAQRADAHAWQPRCSRPALLLPGGGRGRRGRLDATGGGPSTPSATRVRRAHHTAAPSLCDRARNGGGGQRPGCGARALASLSELVRVARRFLSGQVVRDRSGRWCRLVRWESPAPPALHQIRGCSSQIAGDDSSMTMIQD